MSDPHPVPLPLRRWHTHVPFSMPSFIIRSDLGPCPCPSEMNCSRLPIRIVSANFSSSSNGSAPEHGGRGPLAVGHGAGGGGAWVGALGQGHALPQRSAGGMVRVALDGVEGPPPPLQGAKDMPSHCPPDGKCPLYWHLQPTVTASNRLGNLLRPPIKPPLGPPLRPLPF